MSVRKRPVITVVDARPMNEVGFRDTRADIPKISPPPSKQVPILRPPPPNGNVAIKPNAVPIKPVIPGREKTSDLTDALIFDDHGKKSLNPPPPKPRRTVVARPMTIHVDSQSNLIETDAAATRPVAVKRMSVQLDDSVGNWTQNSPAESIKNEPWVADFGQEPLSSKIKPSLTQRPTIIRVSTEVRPPAPHKSQEAKLQAAEKMTSSDTEAPLTHSAKPKPAVKPKRVEEQHGNSVVGVQSQSEQTQDVRKRPTIIRPTARSSTAEPNDKIQPIKTAPTIIRASTGIHTTSSAEVRPEKQVQESFAAPQPKKRPNIIRASADTGRSDVMHESTAVIGGRGNAVYFSASGTGASSEFLEKPKTGAISEAPEKQNAENWKRMEMVENKAKPPSRPPASPVCTNDLKMNTGPSEKSPETEQKHPPSKPPPPKIAQSAQAGIRSPGSAHDDSKRPSSGGSHSIRNLPQRPATGPSKPSQPLTLVTRAGLPPSLPKRPVLGHPLYHYVASGPRAIALFEYQATQADELQFNAGEVIILEKWINAEWLQGRTETSCGMFPCSFVDILEPPVQAEGSSVASVPVCGAASVPSSSLVTGPRCCARFDYDGDDPGDLVFVAGDVIQLIERVGNEWMKGELNGKVGMFPVSFVEIIEDLPQIAGMESLGQLDADDIATILFDFLGQSGELCLLSGKKVKILGSVSTEWLYGELEDGQRGRFPRAFVDHVPKDLPHFDERSKQEMVDQPHCISLYDYVSNQPDDLSFSAGEQIILLTRISDDWLKGQIGDRQGLLPASFVKIVKDLDHLPPRPKLTSATLPSSAETTHNSATVNSLTTVTPSSEMTDSKLSAGFAAVALYDFIGETEEDLTFHAGEMIEVMEVINDEWIKGRIEERVGIFPAAFVKVSR